MEVEFDPAKNRKNIALRGLSFELATTFDFDSALIVVDDRRNYGEDRYRAIGLLNATVAVMVFTMRGKSLRVISLRHANRKERKHYEESS